MSFGKRGVKNMSANIMNIKYFIFIRMWVLFFDNTNAHLAGKIDIVTFNKS